jgi:ATP-dependent helicase/DNAse subunit B
MHEVLERLYRDPPGDDAIPRPGDVEAWKRRARELLDDASAQRRVADDAIGRVGRHRMRLLIERFLEREAASESPLRPDGALIEASFGDGEHDDRPALGLNGLRLHGKIDRVDVAPGRTIGLVRDYKSGKATPAAKLDKEGKLQPQLYMLALRDLWQIEPLGGVYVPLNAKDARSRGILDKREQGGLLSGEDFVRNDYLDEDTLTDALDAAHTRASEIAAAMKAGRVTRDPIDDKCPKYCRFQPICRRERAMIAEPSLEELEEEET